MMSGRNDFPFTATQWQELEHQALIFKYMVSGIPIPPDLLFTLKRNCLDSRLFTRQPTTQLGSWNCFHMGLGRKVDPEPGRCRRTDGKKWRCSKEAYPDSKYCERHMHRGKNRSRKPVEAVNTTTTAMATNLSSTPNMLSSSSISSKTHPFSLSSMSQNQYHSQVNHPYMNQQQQQQHPHNTPSLLDFGSYSHTNTDYRRNNYVYGMKEEVDERGLFSESSAGTMRTFSANSSVDDSWQLTPLTMSSSSSKCQRNSYSGLQSEYSYLQLQSFTDDRKPRQQHDEEQNTVHRFFDEWPPKHRDSSCLDMDDNKSSNSSSVSTTRLSISIPSSSHDFPIFNSRVSNDG